MHKLVLIHHGESVRDLENRWTGWTDGDLNIPNGIPLVDGLDDALKPIRHYYHGNTDAVGKAAAPLAAHGDA